MKSKFRQIALLLVLIMTLTLMVACGSGDGEATTSEKPDDSSSASTGEKAGLDEDNPIYLAWLSPLTGNYEEYGKTGVAACTLALEDINNSGGILGRKVVIDYFDDKADATESLNSANAIVDANKYVAVIGNYSSTGAMSAIPVFEENKIIYETPIASHADLAKMGQYIFRNGSVQSTESRLVADYMIEAGYKKMACIYMTDDFGLNTWKNWSDQFENVRGGEIVVAENYIVGQTTDFSPLITKIMGYEVDGLYMIADYYDAAKIAIQAKDLGCELQLFGAPMVVRYDTLKLGGDDLNGLIAVSTLPVGSTDPKFVEFDKRYQELKGDRANVHAALWYDTTMHLADAINKAGSTDPDKIKDAIYANEFEALACTFKYDSEGNSIRTYFASQVEGGEWKLKDTFVPEIQEDGTVKYKLLD